MGAVVPLLTSTLISQGVGMALSQSNNNQAVEQLQAKQDLQERSAAANAALEKQRIALSAEQNEEKRKTALKRAVARQRANFAGQGVGTGSGSSQAVLLGMFEESEDEKRDREALDTMRLNAIDQDLSQNRALNVLQRTQLEEKNKISAIGKGASLVKAFF